MADSRIRRPSSGVPFILITVFIDMMGIGVVFPVLPTLIMDLAHVSLAKAAVIGGWLLFTYAFLQFLFAPILGSLSDRFGRRKVLIGSLAALGVDYLIMAVAPNLSWLFVGRALAGIFGATSAVAAAYIADVTGPASRSRGYGYVSAATGLGLIFGPILGGLLGEANARLPFLASAALACGNLLYGLLLLPESLTAVNERPFSWRRANPFGAIRHLAQRPGVRWMFVALCLFMVAQSGLPGLWTYFTMERFGWLSLAVGISVAFSGSLVVIVQIFFLRLILRKIGELYTVYVGFLAFAVGLLGYIWVPAKYVYVFMLPAALGSITGPMINTILSKQVPANAQGELQGGIASANGVIVCIAPVVFTQVFRHFTSVGASQYFPGAPFLLATGALVAGFVITFHCNRAGILTTKSARHQTNS